MLQRQVIDVNGSIADIGNQNEALKSDFKVQTIFFSLKQLIKSYEKRGYD